MKLRDLSPGSLFETHFGVSAVKSTMPAPDGCSLCVLLWTGEPQAMSDDTDVDERFIADPYPDSVRD